MAACLNLLIDTVRLESSRLALCRHGNFEFLPIEKRPALESHPFLGYWRGCSRPLDSPRDDSTTNHPLKESQ